MRENLKSAPKAVELTQKYNKQDYMIFILLAEIAVLNKVHRKVWLTGETSFDLYIRDINIMHIWFIVAAVTLITAIIVAYLDKHLKRTSSLNTNRLFDFGVSCLGMPITADFVMLIVDVSERGIPLLSIVTAINIIAVIITGFIFEMVRRPRRATP